MTAVMDRLSDAAIAPVTPNGAGLDDLRRMLVAQERMLAAQTRMLDALDARREELEELVADMMPIVNAAMLMAMRTLDAADRSGITDWLAGAKKDVDAVRAAPAPGLLALFRRLRAADVRKGLALAVEGLGAIGRASGTPNDTRITQP